MTRASKRTEAQRIHATEYGQLLSVEQANILDKYLTGVNPQPSSVKMWVQMARELTKLGYEEGEEVGFDAGYKVGHEDGHMEGWEGGKDEMKEEMVSWRW